MLDRLVYRPLRTESVMQDSRHQRIAKLALNVLVVAMAVTFIFTYFDVLSQEPVDKVDKGEGVFWVVYMAALILVHYIVVSAWPTRARWAYFWVAAVALTALAVIGLNQESSDEVIVLTTEHLKFFGGFAVLICVPLLYMRFFPPKPSQRPRRRS